MLSITIFRLCSNYVAIGLCFPVLWQNTFTQFLFKYVVLLNYFSDMSDFNLLLNSAAFLEQYEEQRVRFCGYVRNTQIEKYCYRVVY